MQHITHHKQPLFHFPGKTINTWKKSKKDICYKT